MKRETTESGVFAPIVLGPNQPERFYRGGEEITRFRGGGGGHQQQPEDWVASTTTLYGQKSAGLSVLPDGGRLVDAILRDPVDWLGPEHVQRFGSDPMLLVKLLHAGERLPVHAHPDAEFAAARLGHRHGKAEAWYLLADAEIWLGLREGLSAERVRALTQTPDPMSLLAMMHHRRLRAGDTVFVPPGTLHAIGAGSLLAEVQEPEDLSILLEWEGFGELPAAHLGLGIDEVTAAFDLAAMTSQQIDALVAGPADARRLPVAADQFFRFERIVVKAAVRLEKGYSVLIVASGSVELMNTRAEQLGLAAGSTVVVPYGAGDLELTGSGEVLVFRPPAP